MLAKLRIWSTGVRRSPQAASVLITAVVGLILVSIIPLEDLSYDVSSCLRPSTTVTNVVVVYVNQETLKLGTDQGKLKRNYYAQLVNILSQDQAKLVFMDVVFDQTSSIPGADQLLANAIHNQGSVILVAGSEDQDEAGSSLLTTFFAPIAPIADAARGWGHAEVLGNIVRQISGSYAYVNYAGWIAATNLAPKLQMMDEDSERWLNYYGRPETAFRPCLLQDVLSSNIPPGLFLNKIVFVGQNFPYGTIGSFKDTFETPYSRFGSPPSPGVLIHATALLNLVRGDWVRRVPSPFQWLGGIAWALISVMTFYALSRQSKIVLVLAAVFAVVMLCALSFYLQWHLHWWWSWIGPACLQTPIALVSVMLNPKPDRYVAFISYRTEEDGAAALLIQRSLADNGLRTFIDVQSLHAGKFDEQLLREIEAAAFFILILSPNSLARCANDGDWVLREITHALAYSKKIVPILKSGFRFDAKEAMPDLPQIAELKRYQGVVYSNSDFDGFMEKLRALLEAP
jgi:CHASE2 domain-containing sensor protein